MYYQYTPYTAPTNQQRVARTSENIIKVTGIGEISTQPDTALITLGVITENENLAVAQRENSKTSNDIIEALISSGIPKNNVKTIDYRIDVQYQYDDGNQTMVSYRVTHLLQITTSLTEQTGTIVDLAVQKGANTVSNIQFTVSNPEQFYNRGIVAALADATEKAKTVAASLGVTLHNYPTSVKEVTQSNGPIPFQAMVKSEATQILPGEQLIRVVLEVNYTYF